MTKNKRVFDVSQLSEFMSVREAAQEGHLHEVSIRRMLTEKKLTRFKLGKRTLISRKEFRGLIQPMQQIRAAE